MKKFVAFLLVVWLLNSFTLSYSQTINSGNSVNVTQNYIPQSLAASSTEFNCGGYPTTYMPGMFQFDGDLEPFITASHGSKTECVSTDYTNSGKRAPFQDNACLSSAWKVSHGTPEIGIRDGNHFMHVWSGNWTTDNDFEGEGVFYDCELLACTDYSISLRLSSTATISKIYFYIASGLQHKVKNGNEWEPESSFYKVPIVTNAYLVHSITNFNSGTNNWVNITLPTFAPQNSGMKFWIFSEDSKTDITHIGADLLFIDDVTDGLPGSSSTCSGSINYSGGSIPAFTKSNTIAASVMATLANTEFVGGAAITLSPGFKTASNSIFNAHIIPCATGNNCPQGCPTCRTPSSNLTESILEKDNVPLELYKLNVYPNPSNGEINIDRPTNEKIVSVNLIEEATGREIGFTGYEDLPTHIKLKVDKSTKGIYIIYIKTDVKTYAERIWIQSL